MTRVVVDPWDPAYGTSADDAGAESEATVDVDVEAAPDAWAPLPAPPAGDEPPTVVFVDGVRRVDARVWIESDRGEAEPGLCASWAAGAVVCSTGTGTAVAAVEVGRGLFSASHAATDLVTSHGTFRRVAATSGSPEHLSLALQGQMTWSEIAAAGRVRGADPGLLVVDGPLRGRQHLTEAVGMVKTHHTHYLPAGLRPLLRRLAAGERTPLVRISSGGFVRYSWYVRLPGGGDAPMAGIVRCECSADLDLAVTRRLAGWTAGVLPRFASQAHKDTRAPQNLYPIGGLERQLRRRMGDTRLLYRALRAATASPLAG
jgi:hypothetical protein